MNYLNAVAEECREILAELGYPTIDSMLARRTCCEKIGAEDYCKIQLDSILQFTGNLETRSTTAEKYSWPPKQATTFDDSIIAELDWDVAAHSISRSINNMDRNIGTRLSGEISRRGQVAKISVELKLEGSAGQSLGAFPVTGRQYCVNWRSERLCWQRNVRR